MSIRFTCPKCQTKHSLADNLAGKTAVCPCGQKLKVPSATSAGTAGMPDGTDPFGNILEESPGGDASSGKPGTGKRVASKPVAPQTKVSKQKANAGTAAAQQATANAAPASASAPSATNPAGGDSPPSAPGAYGEMAGYGNPGYDNAGYGNSGYGNDAYGGPQPPPGYGAGMPTGPGYGYPPGYGGAPMMGGPGMGAPGGHGAPGYGAPPYGPAGMPGYPGGPMQPMAMAPAGRRFRLRLSVEAIAVIALVVIGLGVWLAVRYAQSQPADDAAPFAQDQDDLGDDGSVLPSRNIAERANTDRANRQARPITPSPLPRPAPPANSTRGTSGSQRPSGSSTAGRSNTTNHSNTAGHSNRPVTYSQGTPSSGAGSTEFPAGGGGLREKDPEAEAALGDRVWIGQMSLRPPRGMVLARNEIKPVGRIAFGECIYASGPGVTDGTDLPQSAIEITIARPNFSANNNAIKAVVENLRTSRGLQNFHAQSSTPQTVANGVRFTYQQFSAKDAEGQPVQGTVYFNYYDDGKQKIAVIFTILSRAERDSLHFRTLKAAVASVEYGRWYGDRELAWLSIDGTSFSGKTQGRMWESLEANQLDLSPIEQYDKNLGPEERFGNFVMRRPLGLLPERLSFSTPWFGWSLTMEDARTKREYDFQVRVRKVDNTLDANQHVWSAFYSRERVWTLTRDDALQWFPDRSGLDEQNGLTIYRLVGQRMDYSVRNYVFCYVAIHDGQMIVVSGSSTAPPETDRGYELMEAAARTLRPLGTTEQVATPIAWTDDPKQDRTNSSYANKIGMLDPAKDGGLPNWTPPRRADDDASPQPETRFGVFAMRLPQDYVLMPHKDEAWSRIWYLAKRDPQNREHVFRISTHRATGNYTLRTDVVGSGTEFSIPKDLQITWNHDQDQFGKLHGLKVFRTKGSGSFSGLRRSGVAEVIVAAHTGQTLEAIAYSPGAEDGPEMQEMIAALLTIRPLKEGDQVPTLPTSGEVHLRQERGIE